VIFLIKISIFCANIIYFFIKLFPTRNKVTMISRQSNDINIDFELLKKSFQKKDSSIRIVVLSKTLPDGYNANLSDKVKYIFHMIKQMYHIATSRVVILDSYCIVISILKHKKKLTIIQMWHAMGAFKKFGYSIIGKSEGTSKKIIDLMRMHKNYDFVFVSSSNCINYYMEAFDVAESKIKVFPLPKVDLLTNNQWIQTKSIEIVQKYPELEKKKNILYVPTFRKNKDIDITQLIKSINYKEYNLIVKVHPLSNLQIQNKNVYTINDFSSLELLTVSDYVVTDYSAITFEAALMNKPLYFYVPDFEEYYNDRDFYFTYKEEVPGNVYISANELMENIKIENYSLKKIKQFKTKYIKYEKGNNTEKIVNFIIEIINEKECEPIEE